MGRDSVCGDTDSVSVAWPRAAAGIVTSDIYVGADDFEGDRAESEEIFDSVVVVDKLGVSVVDDVIDVEEKISAAAATFPCRTL